MTRKLTLSLDDKIIAKAKKIAARKKTSISKIVSNYFEKLPDEDPTVLIGLLRLKNKSAATIENAIENARWEHLKTKHGL